MTEELKIKLTLNLEITQTSVPQGLLTDALEAYVREFGNTAPQRAAEAIADRPGCVVAVKGSGRVDRYTWGWDPGADAGDACIVIGRDADGKIVSVDKSAPIHPTAWMAPLGATTPEPEVKAAKPFLVDSTMSADRANQAYGDRYGVDWAYANDPDHKSTARGPFYTHTVVRLKGHTTDSPRFAYVLDSGSPPDYDPLVKFPDGDTRVVAHNQVIGYGHEQDFVAFHASETRLRGAKVRGARLADCQAGAFVFLPYMFLPYILGEVAVSDFGLYGVVITPRDAPVPGPATGLPRRRVRCSDGRDLWLQADRPVRAMTPEEIRTHFPGESQEVGTDAGPR